MKYVYESSRREPRRPNRVDETIHRTEKSTNSPRDSEWSTVASDPETGIIRIDFNKSVEWLGMEPQHAINLAQSLIKHARAVSKTPIVVQLH